MVIRHHVSSCRSPADGGRCGGAEAVLQEAFAFVEQSGERFWLADLHRFDGQIALKRPEPDRARAEACFLKAIDIARSQEARLLELRAATDLARLWRDAGSPEIPARCWSRSSRRSRAARRRGMSATPARCWPRSVEQLAALSAWATEHRFEIKRGVQPCIVSVAFGRCL